MASKRKISLDEDPFEPFEDEEDDVTFKVSSSARSQQLKATFVGRPTQVWRSPPSLYLEDLQEEEEDEEVEVEQEEEEEEDEEVKVEQEEVALNEREDETGNFWQLVQRLVKEEVNSENMENTTVLEKLKDTLLDVSPSVNPSIGLKADLEDKGQVHEHDMSLLIDLNSTSTQQLLTASPKRNPGLEKQEFGLMIQAKTPVAPIVSSDADIENIVTLKSTEAQQEPDIESETSICLIDVKESPKECAKNELSSTDTLKAKEILEVSLLGPDLAVTPSLESAVPVGQFIPTASRDSDRNETETSNLSLLIDLNSTSTQQLLSASPKRNPGLEKPELGLTWSVEAKTHVGPIVSSDADTETIVTLKPTEVEQEPGIKSETSISLVDLIVSPKDWEKNEISLAETQEAKESLEEKEEVSPEEYHLHEQQEQEEMVEQEEAAQEKDCHQEKCVEEEVAQEVTHHQDQHEEQVVLRQEEATRKEDHRQKEHAEKVNEREDETGNFWQLVQRLVKEGVNMENTTIFERLEDALLDVSPPVNPSIGLQADLEDKGQVHEHSMSQLVDLNSTSTQKLLTASPKRNPGLEKQEFGLMRSIQAKTPVAPIVSSDADIENMVTLKSTEAQQEPDIESETSICLIDVYELPKECAKNELSLTDTLKAKEILEVSLLGPDLAVIPSLESAVPVGQFIPTASRDSDRNETDTSNHLIDLNLTPKAPEPSELWSKATPKISPDKPNLELLGALLSKTPSPPKLSKECRGPLTPIAANQQRIAQKSNTKKPFATKIPVTGSSHKHKLFSSVKKADPYHNVKSPVAEYIHSPIQAPLIRNAAAKPVSRLVSPGFLQVAARGTVSASKATSADDFKRPLNPVVNRLPVGMMYKPGAKGSGTPRPKFEAKTTGIPLSCKSTHKATITRHVLPDNGAPASPSSRRGLHFESVISNTSMDQLESYSIHEEHSVRMACKK